VVQTNLKTATKMKIPNMSKQPLGRPSEKRHATESTCEKRLTEITKTLIFARCYTYTLKGQVRKI
jgi:hypothetical protein